ARFPCAASTSRPRGRAPSTIRPSPCPWRAPPPRCPRPPGAGFAPAPRRAPSAGRRACAARACGPSPSAAAPLQEHQLLEEVHVLLVLDERPVKRRDGALGSVGNQRLGGD